MARMTIRELISIFTDALNRGDIPQAQAAADAVWDKRDLVTLSAMLQVLPTYN
jgi:hypothetical protein